MQKLGEGLAIVSVVPHSGWNRYEVGQEIEVLDGETFVKYRLLEKREDGDFVLSEVADGQTNH